MAEQKLSILYPTDVAPSEYRVMSDTAWHDLGMDQICLGISKQDRDRLIIHNVMVNLSANPRVSSFRGDVFEDIIRNKRLQEEIIDILNKVNVLQEYMGRNRNMNDNEGVWTLTRRLQEVSDYITCVESLESCLSSAELKSEGLTVLRDYVSSIQKDCHFAELKKDIKALKLETQKVKSLTLGVNLGEYYDVISVGIVSMNEKPFSKAGVLSGFHQKLLGSNQIQKEADWKQNYTYHPAEGDKKVVIDPSIGKTILMAANPLMALGMGMGGVAADSAERNLLEHMNDVASKLLASSVKKLKEVLAKYATVNIGSITGLIPEFMYFILWARYMAQLEKEGYLFSKASVMDSLEDEKGMEGIENQRKRMDARGVYNLKLASLSKTEPSEIVGNELDFTREHNLYLLTGANRGGKTTITQTIGQLFVLAQGGIYIPGESFEFCPVDGIWTHFPADEDKTMDFGRLGEECYRFRELFQAATSDSLLLLNETFSTTSFEEGYYIAADAIRAILTKGARTIYNTHMHKLARDLDDLNSSHPDTYQAASLIVKAEEGKRSYKVSVEPPQGQSLAIDIAKKYGVTYEQLI